MQFSASIPEKKKKRSKERTFLNSGPSLRLLKHRWKELCINSNVSWKSTSALPVNVTPGTLCVFFLFFYWKGRTRKRNHLARLYLPWNTFFRTKQLQRRREGHSAAHTRVSVSVFVSEAALRHANSQHWQPSVFACDFDRPVWLSHPLKAQLHNRKVNVGGFIVTSSQ